MRGTILLNSRALLTGLPWCGTEASTPWGVTADVTGSDRLLARAMKTDVASEHGLVLADYNADVLLRWLWNVFTSPERRVVNVLLRFHQASEKGCELVAVREGGSSLLSLFHVVLLPTCA